MKNQHKYFQQRNMIHQKILKNKLLWATAFLEKLNDQLSNAQQFINKKKSIKRKSNEISADEVKQKIDLAVAYIEMGEKKNARTTINQLKKFNLSAVEKKLIKDLNKNL